MSAPVGVCGSIVSSGATTTNGIPDRAAAQAERAAVHAHVQAEVASGRMTAREAQDARYKIGLTLESSYHSGYAKPLGLGGAEFLCVCLSYFGGWRSSVGDYTEMVGHTGDAEAADSHEERFDHPARTWASATHRAFTLQSVAVAMANATYEYVQAESDKAMRQVLGATASARQETVTLPTAAAGQRDWEHVDATTTGSTSTAPAIK